MNNKVMIVVVAFLVAVLGYAAYTSLEYYEEDTDIGWGKEARRNRFLAAELYAESLDIETQSYDSYLKLGMLDDIDTLFIAESGQVISENRLDELMNWVSEGGHLVVAAQPPSDWKNDRILEYFDLEAVRTEYRLFDDYEAESAMDEDTGRSVANEAVEEPEEPLEFSDSASRETVSEKKKKQKWSDQLREFNEAVAAGESIFKDEDTTSLEKSRNYEASVDGDEITQLRFKHINYELRARFDPSAGLTHPSFHDAPSRTDEYRVLYWTGDAWGNHLVQLELGYGIVTVLSSPDIFDSSHILYFDHALLWQTLIEGGDSLALLYGSDMPTLWFMLKTFMPEVLIAFMCLVVAWLWYKMQRFGSVTTTDYQIRRSILEHIAATSEYYWRGGWQSKLLQPLQLEIAHRAEKLIPAYSTASEDERLALLAHAANLTTETVSTAMQASAGFNEEHFTQVVRTLQRIKDSL